MDCLGAKEYVEAVLSGGRGFEDDEKRRDYQAVVDHVRICGCYSCTAVRRILDGEGIPVSIGQA